MTALQAQQFLEIARCRFFCQIAKIMPSKAGALGAEFLDWVTCRRADLTKLQPLL